MNLHVRALEALVGQLDARVAWLESENNKLRSELARSVAPAAPERVAPTMGEAAKPEKRTAEPSFLFEPHTAAPSKEESPVKNLSEAQKRALLLANGWTCHDEIESQNIRVCWENGAKWQTLEVAYEIVMTEQSKSRLRAAGWESVVDPVDEIERWKRPANGELLMFHVACAEVTA